MWKFGIASIASLCVLTGAVAVPIVMADAPTTAPAGTDKIEGKVVDPNGQPVANVTVNLFPGHEKKAAKPADPTAVLPGNSAQPLAKQKRTPIATTTTANDGTFSFTGLADGKYIVAVHDKGVGNGHQAVELSPTNPDDSSVTITLAAPKAKNAQ